MEIWVQMLFAALLACLTGILAYVALSIDKLNDKIANLIARLENHEVRLGGLEKRRR